LVYQVVVISVFSCNLLLTGTHTVIAL